MGDESAREYYDIVSKTFASEDDAFEFYNSYALEKGFSVRKSYVEWDEANQDIILRKLVCRVEDELLQVKREFQRFRCMVDASTQSTFTAAYVQKEGNVRDDRLSPNPPFDASTRSTGQAAATTPAGDHVVQNKPLEKDVTDQTTPSPKPVFDNDYKLTDEDIEVAAFLRQSYEDADVVDVGETVLKVHHLKQNVIKKFIFDEVIHAYAHISNIETDTTSVLYPKDTRKLLQSYGGTARAHGPSESNWLARIAKKCVGRRTVRIPFNVNNMHWHLLVLNFDKEEIQVLNSLPLIRDEAKETTLVECIQTCIIEAVQGGLVQTPGPINITEWKKVCYTNIPQQEDGYSCGSYTLKYMLYWDGEKMTDDFTQAQIHIFNWKICTSLLRSDCNTLRLESYEKPILKKAYKARMAKLDKDNAADDDIQVMSNPNDASKKEESPPNDASIKEISPPRPIGSQKRKRGRPRKIETLKPTNPVKDQYKLATDAVTGLVEGRARRKSNPGPQQVSPYKEL